MPTWDELAGCQRGLCTFGNVGSFGRNFGASYFVMGLSKGWEGECVHGLASKCERKGVGDVLRPALEGEVCGVAISTVRATGAGVVVGVGTVVSVIDAAGAAVDVRMCEGGTGVVIVCVPVGLSGVRCLGGVSVVPGESVVCPIQNRLY